MSLSKRINTPSLQCIVSKNENKTSQYTIAVGKKVQKSAVKRNRIKRILRPALRAIFQTLPSPIHVRVVVKKDCSTKRSIDMMKELEILQTL